MSREAAVACGALAPRRPRSKLLTLTHEDGSDLERAFVTLSRQFLPGTVWEREVVFAAPRKWRIDFSYGMLAVEVEGRGHQHENRYTTDIEKYNQLSARGYRLFRCTRAMLENDPKAFFDLLKGVL